eukprot:CAMPEP_0180131592 /NCGR_PEP_ID=MMETSP0986-20121125/8506_1 /TAXON_ID=697907 /ORGANISM="non described non described, Strain CCMP2293" /LENGTH=35 /DNA_ID= /DNA_START= /DNA_END= /DNA_ORIENTATION=
MVDRMVEKPLCRGTSLIRKCLVLGRYSMPMVVLGG